MTVFKPGDTWRERGKRGRAVLVQSVIGDDVVATFVETRKAVHIRMRTLLKYFIWDAS